MYSLDINFLKDRPDYAPKVAARSTTGAIPIEGMLPLYIGVGVGLLLPAVIGGMALLLQHQADDLLSRQAELDRRLEDLSRIEQQVGRINSEATQLTTETKDLASIFNQIKPWSAMLEDIRERTPPGVQINTIKETEGPPPPTPPPLATPAPAAAPSGSPSPVAAAIPTPIFSPGFDLPVTKVEIIGYSNSFNEVNDFLLTLQKSPFLKPNKTQLVTATLVENPTIIQPYKPNGSVGQAQDKLPAVKLPKVVSFTIVTNLNTVPASELIRELDRRGSVGLVTRIKTLQDKGVITPNIPNTPNTPNKGGTKL